eukprot:7797591-Pyramimonas_sp.AAC.1
MCLLKWDSTGEPAGESSAGIDVHSSSKLRVSKCESTSSCSGAGTCRNIHPSRLTSAAAQPSLLRRNRTAALYRTTAPHRPTAAARSRRPPVLANVLAESTPTRADRADEEESCRSGPSKTSKPLFSFIGSFVYSLRIGLAVPGIVALLHLQFVHFII